MRLIIAGSRHLEGPDVERVVHEQLECVIATHGRPSCVLSGCASGIDRMGERCAKRLGIAAVRWPANWSKYGKAAGPMRNADMARNADALLLIWDGRSRGSANMAHEAEKRGLWVRAVIYPANGGAQ